MTGAVMTWRSDRGAPDFKQTYMGQMPDGEWVYIYCARIVANVRFRRGDRRRYRFEWRATVADEARTRGFNTYEDGRVIARGRTSAECQAAVEALAREGVRP